MISIAPPNLPLLASLQREASFPEAVSYQFAGLAVVFLSLASLWALCEIMSRFFNGTESAAAKSSEKTVSAGGSHPAPGRDADGAVTAVIAAAVYATLGRGVAIRQISAPDSALPNPQLAAWSLQGRLQHHTSHTPR